MLYRLVHSQNSEGALLIPDIEAGLPNEAFGFYYKQPVYVPYYRTYFDNDGLVAVDRTQPGYVDLVPSDKVKLSEDDGCISGLAANGFLTVVNIPTGALDAPTISSTTHDTTTSATSGTDDGLVDITGTNLLSYNPDTTSIELTDGVTTSTVTADDAGVSVTATSITITAAAHGFASDGSEDITEVTVTANKQSVTDASVTII